MRLVPIINLIKKKKVSVVYVIRASEISVAFLFWCIHKTSLDNLEGPQDGSMIGLKTTVLGGLTVDLFWFLCMVVATPAQSINSSRVFLVYHARYLLLE